MVNFKKLESQYIGGEWRDGSSQQKMENKNPYNDDLIATTHAASKSDVDEAYQAAAKAQRDWEKVSSIKKREIMENAVFYIEENNDDIAKIIMEELGATKLKADFEVGLVINMIKEASTFPARMVGSIHPSATDEHKENRVYRKPLGVVGVLSPFNFPFFLSVKSVAPALASSNGVVLKPHEDTTITGGTMIAKIFEEAGLPKGLLNVISTEISEIGDSLVDHPIPQSISFTGSTPVGKHIGEVAGRNLKEAHLELGGNNAFIVLDDADIDLAVSAAVFSRFTHQGQICMSSNRIILPEAIYDEFVEKFTNKVSELKCGDPQDPETIIGPLINKKQVENTQKLVDQAIEEGATPIVNGGIEGNVFKPVVFADVKPDMSYIQEEFFAPVVSILKVSSDEEAVEVANNSPYGLSGALHTNDVERGTELAKQVYTGMIHINDGSIDDDPTVAFGGVKNSGIGRLNGKWSLDAFTTTQWISVQHKPRQYPYS
ncbi:aldehyde dehydrogenase family protein [Virgibacillus sp. W0181]|uniref:aldehyde dehydrogenase family protein n=1 Tax=Virgibacillus sp. W0181 TaxID=3391581 RepID=UPI003F472C48